VALARKRAREERVALVSITDWAENGSLVQQGSEQREHWASPTE